MVDPASKIVPLTKVLTRAFHGTSKIAADSISKSGFQISSTGWLGKGVYFFQDGDALARAQEWARRQASQGKLPSDLALLSASVELGCCLDFGNPEHGEIIRGMAKVLKNKGFSLSDAQVIEFVAKETAVDTVLAPEFRKPYEGSHFQTFVTNYLCVRSVSKIQNLQLVFTFH